jgi:hypothetical protein
MRKVVLYLFVLTLNLLVGCNEKSNIKTLKISMPVDSLKMHPLSMVNIFSSIELIPLETNKGSLIKRSSKLIVHDDLYYVLDNGGHKVVVFGNDGKFMFSTNTFKGKGPGEYLSLTDFIVNKDGDIEILNPRQLKINTYSIKGEIKQSYSLSKELLPISTFFKIDNECYLFYCPVKRPPNDYEKYYSTNYVKLYSTQTSKIIDQFICNNENANYMGVTVLFPFHECGDFVTINHLYSSEYLYYFDKNKLEIDRVCEFDLGENTFKIEDLPSNLTEKEYRRFMPDNRNRYMFILDKIQNNKYLLIYCYTKNQVGVIFYNKQNKTKSLYMNKAGEVNQIPLIDYMDDTYLYYLCEPNVVEYYIDNTLLDPKSKTLLGEIEINDNPVLIKYTMR